MVFKDKKQLKISKVGEIITFKDLQTGNRYFVLLKYMKSMCYGKLNYSYANEYIPRPEGKPKGYKHTKPYEKHTSIVRPNFKLPSMVKL